MFHHSRLQLFPIIYPARLQLLYPHQLPSWPSMPTPRGPASPESGCWSCFPGMTGLQGPADCWASPVRTPLLLYWRLNQLPLSLSTSSRLFQRIKLFSVYTALWKSWVELSLVVQVISFTWFFFIILSWRFWVFSRQEIWWFIHQNRTIFNKMVTIFVLNQVKEELCKYSD